jgi:hypothetical protein
VTQPQSRNSFDLILDELCDMFDAMLDVVAGSDTKLYKFWVKLSCKNRVFKNLYTHD